MLSEYVILEEQESNTLLIEDPSLYYGFVQLPKLVLYARNLSRDAKLLYAVLLGYAWQEQRCFPGYNRLCEDLDASENMVRKYMRELEAAHLLSQRRRGLGKTNIYTLHDLRTAKIEVQEPHKTKVLEPQESYDYEETNEIKTDEIKNRTIGERPAIKSPRNAENEEKALVGGMPAGASPGTPVGIRPRTVSSRRATARSKHVHEQETSPRDQALAKAKAAAGVATECLLSDLGGSNPEGGTQTILEALVEVNTPAELLGDLIALGAKRLKQQQELKQQQGLTHIANPTGYLIAIMRDLALEAWLKGWDLAQIQAEDEEKHAQAMHTAQRGGSPVCMGESEAYPPEEEASPAPDEAALTDPSAAYASTAYLPDGVEVADAATVATWHDAVPDAEGSGQPRRVSMLWGFVREAISAHLNLARRSQLAALVPKWDATRPRTLLLLCDTTWDARAAELYLRREIEPQLDKLLSRFFDEMQVVYAPGQEERA